MTALVNLLHGARQERPNFNAKLAGLGRGQRGGCILLCLPVCLSVCVSLSLSVSLWGCAFLAHMMHRCLSLSLSLLSFFSTLAITQSLDKVVIWIIIN